MREKKREENKKEKTKIVLTLNLGCMNKRLIDRKTKRDKLS